MPDTQKELSKYLLKEQMNNYTHFLPVLKKYTYQERPDDVIFSLVSQATYFFLEQFAPIPQISSLAMWRLGHVTRALQDTERFHSKTKKTCRPIF